MVSRHVEVYLVFLGETRLFPLGHGTQAAHQGELVPYAGLVLFGKLEERLAGLFAHGVLHVAALAHLAVHVVVRLENEGNIRVHSPDALDENVVVVAEGLVVELLDVRVVDADGENHQVGLEEGEFLLEQRADFFKIVRDAGAVDAHVGIDDARVVRFGDDACHGEARAHDGERLREGNKRVANYLLQCVRDDGGVGLFFGRVGCCNRVGLLCGIQVDPASGEQVNLRFFLLEAGRVHDVAVALEHRVGRGFLCGRQSVLFRGAVGGRVGVQRVKACAVDGVLHERIDEVLRDFRLQCGVGPAEGEGERVYRAGALEYVALREGIVNALDIHRIDYEYGDDVIAVAVPEEAEFSFFVNWGGVVLVEQKRKFCARVAGADGNAEQAERLLDFAEHVLAHVPHALVLGAVAGRRVRAGGGIREHEAATGRRTRIFLDQVLADSPRDNVGLDMRTADMENVDLALVLEHERVHFLEEGLERIPAARELDDVERRIDEVVFGKVDDVASGRRNRGSCE